MTQIYIRADKAHEILDVSKTTFWRMSKTEGFPNKKKIQGVSLYSIQELIEWVESHSDSRAS
jgi:predicted DNA-binding transcriptional regulator AlpA